MSVKVKKNRVQRSTSHSKLYRQIKGFLKAYKILKCKKIVAVSGGVDSIVLFFILAEIAKQEGTDYPLPIYIAHQQRKKDDENKDVERIQSLLDAYGVSLYIKSLAIVGNALSEEKLRHLRQDALMAYAKQNESSCIFSGHHLDDQVENFFIRLFSGAHFQGLSGMAEFSGGCFYKPFLNIEKQTLLNVARDNELLFNLDSSNLDTDFTRNHIRNVLLPFLSAQYGDKYKTNVLSAMQDLKHVTQHLKKDLIEMLKVSKANKGCFLREPMLKFSDLQLRVFLSHFFNEKNNELNRDQLDAMVHLLRKGQGSYSLTKKAAYTVHEKKVCIIQDA